MSDIPIPRTCDILDRACDLLSSAYRLNDEQAAGQLGRLIRNLPGARLCWQLGALHIVSPSGGRYQVTRAGCSCPNGTKSHARACWHLAAFELLLDMFETECDTADMAADPPGEPSPLGDEPGDSLPTRRPIGDRIAHARSVVWAVNWNS